MYLHREEETHLFGMLGWKEALTLIGPRRSGKTTLAKRLLELSRAKGRPGTYLDMEALGAPSSPEALKTEISKVPEGGLVVIDEIQAIDGWAKAVRGELESGARHLVLTGSSASLLSKEIASSLGGRAIPEAVLPLSFRDAKRWGIRSLEQYLKCGGYPECVLRPDDAARLHKLYLELTILRDVAARKGIREMKPLSDLALLLLSEPGKTISAKKTSEMLGISQPTFRSFADALCDAFLILSVPPYVRSPRERLVADAKHYSWDVGLQSSVSISSQDDFGRKLENLVAIELSRRGYSLSYLKTDEGECDFIAQKSGTRTLAVQVWGGNGAIPEREWAGLKIGITKARAEGLLLSWNEVEANREDNRQVMRIGSWLLEPVKE